MLVVKGPTDGHGATNAGANGLNMLVDCAARGMPWTGVNGARIAAVPHVAVLDADPPVFGYSTAQRRCRAGQVHVLVADLPGRHHRRGCGLLAGPAMNASTRSKKPSTWARAWSLAAGSSQSASSAAFKLEAASYGAPACAATTAVPAACPQPCTTAITPRALRWARLIKLNVSSLDWLGIWGDDA